MPPRHFWAVAEAKIESHKPRTEYAGGMSQSDVEQIYAEAFGDIDD